MRKGDCQHGAGVDQRLPNYIQPKIQTFKRSHAEQHEIALLTEHHIISGRGTAGVNNRVSDVALDVPAVGDHEALPSLHFDSKGFKYTTRNPGKLASRVYHGLRELADAALLRNVLHADGRA